MKLSKKELMDLAERASDNAYAPYSHFSVGAALLCSDGSIYTGCNVENAAFGSTCCAERVALFTAVSAGKKNFCAIAIFGKKQGAENIEKCYPCGSCRQVLSEFCSEDFDIIVSDGKEYDAVKLGELLPRSFKFKEK